MLFAMFGCFFNEQIFGIMLLCCSITHHMSSGTGMNFINHKASKKKMFQFANRVDPEEVAHNEPPLLGLLCLHSSLVTSLMMDG